MAVIVLQVCLAVLSLIPCVLGAFISEYALDDYCGKTLRMSFIKSAIKLKLTDRNYYKRNMDCGMYIKYDDWVKPKQLSVQFIEIDIDCSDHVQLSSDSSQEDGRQYCGESKPLPKSTKGADLYVMFTSDGDTQDNGFTLLITTFHTGVCDTFEIECDNGRCIDFELKRDGYDNCGDNSDEYDAFYKDYNWWIWMIVGIVVFVVICVVVIIVICCCCCRKKTPGTVIKAGTQPVVHYQTGTQAAQASPWYGAPSQSMGLQGTFPPGPTAYQPPVMQPPPAYTSASGSAVYPPPESAVPGSEDKSPVPPTYSDKM